MYSYEVVQVWVPPWTSVTVTELLLEVETSQHSSTGVVFKAMAIVQLKDY